MRQLIEDAADDTYIFDITGLKAGMYYFDLTISGSGIDLPTSGVSIECNMTAEIGCTN